jgi:hypothetical protein
VPRPAARAAASRPVLAALAALLAAALSVTGCVSMPSGGPVLSYPVTQGPDAQNQPYVQIQPQPPSPGWTPSQIVQGFLTASANFGNYPQVAMQYLTPDEQKTWDPSWSAIVYKSGPNVSPAAYPPGAKHPANANVTITGSVQANLLGFGKYSVPSASAPGGSADKPVFGLVKVGGQWRISDAPLELLLTSNSFENDYQLRNLYFFDPLFKSLVPDSVYVPLRASLGNLMDGLVNELITPPTDWLSNGATKTAFPPKTVVSSVTLNGVTAVVDLTGAAIGKASGSDDKASSDVMQQVSAQLLSTLSGAAPSSSSGQGVQSVEVVVNGKPWIPPQGQGNPVQRTPRWHPALGMSNEFYSVDSKGYLTSRTSPASKPANVARIGTGYTQIAVSPDGMYLAALRGSTLYTGRVADGSPTKRGSGFMAISWDASDDLWASQGTQIVMFRGAPGTRQPLSQMVPVEVNSVFVGGPYTALQVAPDGVRVAIVSGGSDLTFGAISRQQSQNPLITFSPVQESPLTQVQTAPQAANFIGLSWYGPDDVITLATPGPAVTDYPVSGATPQPIQAEDRMQTITASYKQPLIAGLSNGRMVSDASLTGSWMNINNADDTPASGSSPTYPG